MDGDIVLVADGIYPPVDYAPVRIDGQGITLRSVDGPAGCIIDGGGHTNGFWITGGTPPELVIEGFTITNSGNNAVGLGNGSAATIRNCVVQDSHGGPVLSVLSGSLLVERCVFKRHRTSEWLIYVSHGSVTLTQCAIFDNQVSATPGVIWLYEDAAITLRQCTMLGNAVPNGCYRLHVGRNLVGHRREFRDLG